MATYTAVDGRGAPYSFLCLVECAVIMPFVVIDFVPESRAFSRLDDLLF